MVKARLFPDQQAVVRSALRALFQAQPGMRRQMIVSAYTAGDISLGKAAELMGISHEEMKDVLAESGVEVHLGPRTAEEVLQDAPMPEYIFDTTVLSNLASVGRLDLLEKRYRKMAATTVEVSDELRRGFQA